MNDVESLQARVVALEGELEKYTVLFREQMRGLELLGRLYANHQAALESHAQLLCALSSAGAAASGTGRPN